MVNGYKGKAEGKAERDIEITQSMLLKGYPIQDIMCLTGLSKADIAHLAYNASFPHFDYSL